MGCNFIITFNCLQPWDSVSPLLPFRTSSNTYVSTPHLSIHYPSVCVLFFGITEKLKPVPGPLSRPGPVIPLWLWASFFNSSTKLIFDGLVVSDLYWIGKWCFGGCANSFLYVLVSLSQKDWVRKARVYFLLMYTTNLTELLIQNRFHDQDLDELQYQFGSTDMVRCLATSIWHNR